MITLSPNWIRFIGIVAMGGLWGALSAIAANIAGAGVVSSVVALAITAVIGVLENQFSTVATSTLGNRRTFFGAVSVK